MIKPSNGCIWIASFDIGRRNFAFSIEEINISAIKDIPNKPLGQRYNKDGTLQLDYRKTMQILTDSGKIILLEHKDLTDNTKGIDDITLLINLTKYLDSFRDYWIHCESFVIEQQMNFGNNRNHNAIKLSHHVMSYFIIQFANFKNVIEFGAYNKTRVLGAPKKQSKPERKKWAVEKAIQILIDRGDEKSLEMMRSKSKQDDISDVIVQSIAYTFKRFLDN
jgi:hypothetical protein